MFKPPEEMIKRLGSEPGAHPLKVSRRSPTAKVGYLIGVAVFVAFGIGMPVLCLSVKGRNDTDQIIYGLFGFGTGLGFLGITWFWWMKFYRGTARLVFIYEEGVVWETAASGWHVALWTNLNEVFREENDRIGPSCSFVRATFRSQQELYFGHQIENYHALAGMIQDIACRHMLPAARRRLDAGEALKFGPLQLNKTTLFFVEPTDGKPRRVPLAAVEKVSISFGNLWINERSRDEVGTPLSMIPNYVLLLALLPVQPDGMNLETFG